MASLIDGEVNFQKLVLKLDENLKKYGIRDAGGVIYLIDKYSDFEQKMVTASRNLDFDRIYKFLLHCLPEISELEIENICINFMRRVKTDEEGLISIDTLSKYVVQKNIKSH